MNQKQIDDVMELVKEACRLQSLVDWCEENDWREGAVEETQRGKIELSNTLDSIRAKLREITCEQHSS